MNGLNMTIAGIPLRVRPEFFVGAIIIGGDRFSQPLLLAWWVLAVGVFVALHELGHAFAFRHYGHRPSIEIQMFGGATVGTPGKPLTPKQDIVVSFAGPAVGLVIGSAVYGFEYTTQYQPSSLLVAQVLSDIVWVNLGWSIFNLVPMLPLDGGRLFHAAMRHMLGDGRGRTVALTVSLLVAATVVWLAISSGRTFLAIFAAMFAFQSFRGLRQQPVARSPVEAMLVDQLREGRHVDALSTLKNAPDPSAIDPYFTGMTLAQNGMLDDAVEPLVTAFRRDGRTQAGTLLVRVLIDSGKLTDALRIFESEHGSGLDDDALRNLAGGLFFAERYDDSSRVSETRFRRFNTADAGYNAACALAKLGRIDDAKRWLERAVDAGYRDIEHFDRDEDLAALKAAVDLSDLRAKMERLRQSDPKS